MLALMFGARVVFTTLGAKTQLSQVIHQLTCPIAFFTPNSTIAITNTQPPTSHRTQGPLAITTDVLAPPIRARIVGSQNGSSLPSQLWYFKARRSLQDIGGEELMVTKCPFAENCCVFLI